MIIVRSILFYDKRNPVVNIRYNYVLQERLPVGRD